MHSDQFRLDGKTAIVTGAAAGIGQAIAVSLAAAGADVAVVARREADATLAGIAAHGRRGLMVRADLAQDEPQGIIGQTVEHFGRCDVLVNNAGIIRRADATAFTRADWNEVLAVNLDAAFFLSQAAGRHMIAHGGGRIVNIASMLSFQGGVRVASYTAAKSALAGLTRLLANEWAGRGVNVNAVAPGYVATDNTAALRADPERSRQILERIPAGRWGDPADIGGAVVFLASPAAAYVHGHILAVDGGWLAR